jgi:hypothetical protein
MDSGRDGTAELKLEWWQLHTIVRLIVWAGKVSKFHGVLETSSPTMGDAHENLMMDMWDMPVCETKLASLETTNKKYIFRQISHLTNGTLLIWFFEAVIIFDSGNMLWAKLSLKDDELVQLHVWDRKVRSEVRNERKNIFMQILQVRMATLLIGLFEFEFIMDSESPVWAGLKFQRRRVDTIARLRYELAKFQNFRDFGKFNSYTREMPIVIAYWTCGICLCMRPCWLPRKRKKKRKTFLKLFGKFRKLETFGTLDTLQVH